VLGDFDGDGRADVGVYRPSTGEWFIVRSGSGGLLLGWGAPTLGDVPAPADFDGDGRTDIAVYRRSNGQWFVLRSGDGGLTQLSWGAPALQDVPVPADYDGDGRADVAVYRRTNGEWFILRSGDGGLTRLGWGAPTLQDVPVPADYDGDGRADIAVYRQITGEWFIVQSSAGFPGPMNWGAPALQDVPVPADYDGDRQADIAVYRHTTGQWFIHRSTIGYAGPMSWGAPTQQDVPVPADYDGDGRADTAVYRRASGEWLILRSAVGYVAPTAWGNALDDIPLTLPSSGSSPVASSVPTTGQIANGNFAQGITGFSSDYELSPAALGAEGTYAVARNPQALNPGFSAFGDHTTSSGPMMIVNGMQAPDKVVWSQQVPVEPNTAYSLSAWIASVSSMNPASLQFLIDGRVLGALFRAPLQPGVWTEFRASWTSGTATAALITILDRAVERAGNDFALDDISLVPIGAVPPQDPLSDLVEGVHKLVSPGTPGPVWAESNAWSTIVAGDDDASFPSGFVAARTFGLGRVVIAGHDGIVVNPGLLDNGRFLVNSIRWLDKARRKRVQYTVSHSEWAGAGRFDVLRGMLAEEGIALEPLTGQISTEKLSSGSVLIVGNAWLPFTETEIKAVRVFVENGGGLFLVGLGWSWPGNFDDYPMMRLAKPFQVRWLRTYILDPTDQFDGSAVFTRLYPNVPSATLFEAMAILQSIHEQNLTDLPRLLETDDALRLNFVRSHQLLAVPTREFPLDDAQRRTIFDFCVNLISRFPEYYGRSHIFTPASLPTSAWVRERFWLTWRDALAQTDESRTAIAARLDGVRRRIFERFGVLVLDNQLLDDSQLEFIDRFFTLLPGELHNMRTISVADLLGTPRFETSGFFASLPGAVNIFGTRIGGYSENSFPEDISPGLVDGFSVVVAHEVNHVVDAYYVTGNPTLVARKIDLIRRAGFDDLNYQRSMVGGSFFQENPQEWFASIANQWFTDSAKTLELGLLRFRAGRPEPINQALFFAEVYSRGGDTSRFYRTDTAGRLDSIDVPARRNSQGQIDELRVGNSTYTFVRDDAGNVLAVDLR
jgi:hypothetical protein